MSLFREKIPVAEHELALTKANEASRANLVAFATAAKVEGVEEKSDAELVTAISSAIGIVATLGAENDQLEAQIKKAEEANTALNTNAQDATAALKAANTTIDGVTALFGEKAKAEGFDLVTSVGSIVPEGFTNTIEDGKPIIKGNKEARMPADDLADQLRAGKISQSEFYKQSIALLDN
jgi:hypothetical protein